MTSEIFARRREALRPLIAEAGLDALLVSYAPNRFYLSGFELHDVQCNESAGLLVITAAGEDWLLTDPRYHEAALALWPGDRVVIYRGGGRERIREFLKTEIKGLTGVDARSVSWELAEYLGREANIKPAAGLVEKLRLIKEPGELDLMRASCAVNHRVMEAAPGLLVPGRTEREVAWDIELLFRAPEHGGAEELAFSSIVAVGRNGAKPHAIPGSDRIPENGPVLVDVGCRLADYCSDQTRTFWVGDAPTKEFLRTMDQVREAQDKAIEAMRQTGPGMACAEVYRVAVEAFRAHGVERYFTHGLGHGVGLETHEGPSLSPSSEMKLAPGMVVTVEPGLYYAEWGGIRWEYMAVVTETGVEVF